MKICVFASGSSGNCLLVSDGVTHILLDAGISMRRIEAALRQTGLSLSDISGVLITHEHYDHVGGIDDLRPFSYVHDLPLYADPYSCRHLRERLPYCLVENKYPGVPQLQLNEIVGGGSVDVGGVRITAIPVMHGKLPILGYRIGDVGYVTDMTTMPDGGRALLKGIRLLVVNGLRHEPHPTHQTVEQAVAFSRSLSPNLPTYIIHLSHHVGLHSVEDALLPAGIHFAYDGLVIDV